MFDNLYEKTIKDTKLNIHRLGECLGKGGQGAVYEMKTADKTVLKVKMDISQDDYSIQIDEKKYDLYENRMNYILSLPRISNISLPIRMLKRPYVGYLMQFMSDMESIEKSMIPNDSSSISEWYIKTGGLKKRLLVLKNLAKIMVDFYDKGLVYSDISPKNVFVSQKTSENQCWLIDVDNMRYAGDGKKPFGTPRYMAPEVYNGQANSISSDCYSFALLAYEYLTCNKPFYEGDMNNNDDCWGDENDIFSKIESGQTPWVNQKNNKNNQSKCGLPWRSVCTSEIQELFELTFGENRNLPEQRPSILEWKHALDNACQMMVECSNGHFHFGTKCFLCNAEAQTYIADAFLLCEFIDGDDVLIKERYENSQRWVEQSGKSINIDESLFVSAKTAFSKPAINISKRNQGYKITFDKTVKSKIDLLEFVDDIDGLEFFVLKNKKPCIRIVLRKEKT